MIEDFKEELRRNEVFAKVVEQVVIEEAARLALANNATTVADIDSNDFEVSLRLAVLRRMDPPEGLGVYMIEAIARPIIQRIMQAPGCAEFLALIAKSRTETKRQHLRVVRDDDDPGTA
jgi:hypothetical protein